MSGLYSALCSVYFLNEENSLFKSELWLSYLTTLWQIQSLGLDTQIGFCRGKNLTANFLYSSTSDCQTVKVYLYLLDCSYVKDKEIRNKLNQDITFIEVLERLYL